MVLIQVSTPILGVVALGVHSALAASEPPPNLLQLLDLVGVPSTSNEGHTPPPVYQRTPEQKHTTWVPERDVLRAQTVFKGSPHKRYKLVVYSKANTSGDSWHRKNAKRPRTPPSPLGRTSLCRTSPDRTSPDRTRVTRPHIDLNLMPPDDDEADESPARSPGSPPPEPSSQGRSSR
jgi:hypothetical protein